MSKKYSIIISFFIILIGISNKVNANTDSYLANYLPFQPGPLGGMDVDQEAEAWALCASSLKVLSEIEDTKGNSSTSEDLKNRYNGVKMSIAMSYLHHYEYNNMYKKMPDDEFYKGRDKAFNYGKYQMDNLLSIYRAQIRSDLEYQDFVSIYEKLNKTVVDCINPMSAGIQNMYVDRVQEIIKEQF